MDTARPFPQIGHENPRVPTSPELDDELFDSFFDWQSYCDSTRPDIVSPYLNRRSPQRDLNKLITEIPSVIDHLSLERLESEFLRMKTSFSPDTPSDYSGQTPPELIQGGSTSPSDHSGSIYLERVEEPRRRPEVSLREVQAQDDEWTYPQTLPNKHSSRGYPPSLQVQDDMSRRPFDPSPGLKRRRSGHGHISERRHRQLADPEQTADVRKNGACLPCRVSKIRCHESGVCPTCRKAFPDHAHLVCTRLTPAMVWPVIGRVPDVWSANPAEEEFIRLEPRFFFGKPKDVSILMSSRDTDAPPLRVTIQAYQAEDDSDESPRKAALHRDRVPGHHELQRWVEAQIQRERSSQFKYLLQKFLLSYAHDGHGLPRHDLVSKVHKMSCYFKIWKTSSFTCRDPSNKLSNLPVTVQAELRHIARKALESLEHDVLKQLDDCLVHQGPIKSEEKPAIWACMWQLILIYRDLMSACRSYISHMGAECDSHMVAHAQSHYQWLVDKVFPLVTVFYHYQFRTKKSLEMSMDWIKSSPYSRQVPDSKRIRTYAKDLFASRKEFCEKIQKSKNEVDQMLCALVINHELKKLNARQRNTKSSSKS